MEGKLRSSATEQPKADDVTGKADYGYKDRGVDDEDGEDSQQQSTVDGTSVTQTAERYEFTEATLTLKDGTKVAMSMNGTDRQLSIDGKPIPIVYTYQYDLGKEGNTEYYTNMFSHPDLMGDCSFQIIIDNPNKLFRK